jgi:RNA polymerase sigma factor (sigma-70 family)
MTTSTVDPPAAADRDLLGAFAARADEAAFAELVRRHGPLVRAVCRRVLADRPEADDAFQAVFLVLARKAGAVRRPEALGNWLYGIALRCARRARAAARRAREVPMPDVPAPPPPDSDWADVRPLLDAEVGRLPEKLRAPLVLCELQGLDRAAAAAVLGVPEGTLSSRLARAKERLRRRLVRRGVALSAIGLGLVLAQATARAAVPPAQAAAAVAAAARFAAGPGAVPGPAAAIAHKELAVMVWKKLLLGGLAAAGLFGLVGTGAWVGVPLVAAAVAGDDKKADKDALQGTWKIVLARRDGRSLSDDELKKYNETGMVFDGDSVTAPHKGSFKLDETKTPKHIDLTLDEPENSKGSYEGVYELKGDKLTLVLAERGYNRPAGLDDDKKSTTMRIELERVKK